MDIIVITTITHRMKIRERGMKLNDDPYTPVLPVIYIYININIMSLYVLYRDIPYTIRNPISFQSSHFIYLHKDSYLLEGCIMDMVYLYLSIYLSINISIDIDRDLKMRISERECVLYQSTEKKSLVSLFFLYPKETDLLSFVFYEGETATFELFICICFDYTIMIVVRRTHTFSLLHFQKERLLSPRQVTSFPPFPRCYGCCYVAGLFLRERERDREMFAIVFLYMLASSFPLSVFTF
jgi:hypothetical protein